MRRNSSVFCGELGNKSESLGLDIKSLVKLEISASTKLYLAFI